jgi:transcriptional regulator with XRE-family HTH domain
MKTSDVPEFSRKILGTATLIGLSRADLAGRLEISYSALFRRLAGRAKWKPIELTRLSSALGVPMEFLLSSTDSI